MKVEYNESVDKLIIKPEFPFEINILEKFTLFEIRCYSNAIGLVISKIKEKAFKSTKFELIQEI